MTAETAPMSGRTAIVTGASRGIGREIAKELAARGAAVVLAARTMDSGTGAFEGGIADVAGEIEQAGGSAMAVVTDLTRAEDRENLVARAAERFGGVDILVNNAAATFFLPIDTFPQKRYDLMFEIQVHAPVHLMQLTVPMMRERGRGWIVNISSIASRHPRVPPVDWNEEINATVYGMCKAALERLSTGAAAELYGANIAVNSVAPNWTVPTPGTVFHQLTTYDDPEAEQPHVIARAAAELCSREPRELTGRIALSADLLTELGVPVT